MHTSKLKMALVALLTLFLVAACGDDDDNNSTNNGTTNNGTPTNNDNDAGDSPDGDDDDDADADSTPDGTGGGDLPASFIDRAEDARTASENYFTTFCDCYTDSMYGGDRAACESTFDTGDAADPAEANQCEIDVFNQYQDDFLDLYDCLDQEMSEATQCLSSCPAPDEMSACTEGLQDCTLPQAVTDALEACQGDGA